MNFEKSDLCGIGAMKGLEGALCGVNCLNLLSDSIKILGIHFSFSQGLYNARNYLTVWKSVQEILNLWSTRGLTLAGRIQVFETFGISKMFYISYMNRVSSLIIEELKKIILHLFGRAKKTKIKHSSVVEDFASGSYKDIEIESEIKSLHLMWEKILCDKDCIHGKLSHYYF